MIQIVAQAWIASDVGLLASIQKFVGYYQLIGKEVCVYIYVYIMCNIASHIVYDSPTWYPTETPTEYP